MKYDDDLDWKEKLLLFVVVLLAVCLIFFGLNSIVSAADSLSRLIVTKQQVEKAEELGAIQRTTLEVVNNYGEQSTIDANQLQGSRNE